MEGADQTYHHHTGRGQSLCRGHRGWGAQIRLTIIILAEDRVCVGDTEDGVGDADQTYHHHTGRDRVCVGDTEDGGRRSDLPSSYWQRQSLCRGHRGWRAQIRLTIIILAETEFV